MSLLTDALDQMLLALAEPNPEKAAVHASVAASLTQLHVANASANVDPRRLRPRPGPNGPMVRDNIAMSGLPGTFENVLDRWKQELGVFHQPPQPEPEPTVPVPEPEASDESPLDEDEGSQDVMNRPTPGGHAAGQAIL